jgi:type IV pilus assembly protein PilA
MWLYAALYVLALPFVFALIFVALLVALPPLEASVVNLLIELLILFVLVPMFANALYYRVVQKRVADAKAYRPERETQLRALASVGGTSNAALILVIVLIVPLVGILAAIAIPAYQDYTIRAQVSEGLMLAAEAKTAVAESIYGGEVPKNRTQARLSANPRDASGKYVESIDISNGRIDITYGRAANSRLAGQVLSLTPYAVENGPDNWSIVWRCGAGPAPAAAADELAVYKPGSLALETPRYVPSACRP